METLFLRLSCLFCSVVLLLNCFSVNAFIIKSFDSVRDIIPCSKCFIRLDCYQYFLFILTLLGTNCKLNADLLINAKLEAFQCPS